MNKLKKLLLTIVCLTCSLFAQAQEQVEMADKFREEGKIYVVIAVVLVVLFGLIAYLIILDRKIKKLEDQTS